MFTEPQVQALSSKLSAKHVRTRQHSGMTLSYIEGWHAIAEANRINGFGAFIVVDRITAPLPEIAVHVIQTKRIGKLVTRCFP